MFFMCLSKSESTADVSHLAVLAVGYALLAFVRVGGNCVNQWVYCKGQF